MGFCDDTLGVVVLLLLHVVMGRLGLSTLYASAREDEK